MTDTQPSMPARLEMPVRTASGVVLGVLAVGAAVWGGLLYDTMIVVAATAALTEWHRLVNGGHVARETIPTCMAMVVVVWFAHQAGGLASAWLAIAVGGVTAAVLAASRRSAARWTIPWHGFGALYLGVPVAALIILRQEPRGAAILGALFVAVWTADTGALLFGRWIGGPKLARVLSPNKTWAGFWGGTLAAGAGEALYVGLLGGGALAGAAFGILLALAGHAGDLFESWVKRQFHAKNTGSSIPGHGGVLDRIDSLIFAAPMCALLIYALSFNPLMESAS